MAFSNQDYLRATIHISQELVLLQITGTHCPRLEQIELDPPQIKKLMGGQLVWIWRLSTIGLVWQDIQIAKWLLSSSHHFKAGRRKWLFFCS